MLRPVVLVVLVVQVVLVQSVSNKDIQSSFNVTAENLRASLVDKFSQRRHHLEGLSEYKDQARQYIKDQFESFGLEVIVQSFATEHHMVTGSNVIGILKGDMADTSGDSITVLGAHYDTTRHTSGVDDNGSGVAALLEIARELTAQQCRHKYTTIFVAFDMDETEDQGEAWSACYSSITCGSIAFLGDWFRPYLKSSGNPTMNTALILESIMNYDDMPDSQYIPIEFQTAFPSAAIEIEENGNKGVFLGMLGRKLESGVMSKITEKWRDLPFPELLLQNLELPIDAVPSQYDQVMYSYYMKHSHFNFWVQAGMKAVYFTDTRESRGVMRECYHDMCDDKFTITDDKLRFLAKTVHTITNSVRDFSETDLATCKQPDEELIVLTGKVVQPIQDSGASGQQISLVTMVTVVLLVLSL